MAVFERTGDDQRRSRNLDLLRKLNASTRPRSSLHAACPVPAPYSAGDQAGPPPETAACFSRGSVTGAAPIGRPCAEDCLGRAHRQLQQHCAAPAGVLPSSHHTRRATWPARRPRSAWLPLAFGAQCLVDTRCDPLDPPHRGGCDRRPSRPAGLAYLSWSPPMSMASSLFCEARQAVALRRRPNHGSERAVARAAATPGYGPAQLARYQQGSTHDCRQFSPLSLTSTTCCSARPTPAHW